jgi:N-methylhydantoinase A
MTATASNDAEFATIVTELTERVYEELRAEGIAPNDAAVERYVDCRYEGQSHELRIAAETEFAAVVEAFHLAHLERYGFERRDVGVEAVTFRVAATGPAIDLPFSAPTDGEPFPTSITSIGGVEAAVYDRASLPAGAFVAGPALITELDSTTWLDATSSAVVHESGALVVSVR